MSRREANKADKRLRIEKAARALFAERGFDKTTTRAIADRAEVAAGTVFLYAPTKVALLMQLWRQDIEAHIARAVTAADEDGTLEGWLAFVYGAFIRFYLDDPALSRVYLRAIVFPTPEDHRVAEAGAFTATFLSTVAERVGAAQRQGTVNAALEPVHVAQASFLTYLGVLIGALNGAIPPEHVDTVLEQGFARQFDGFRPPVSTPSSSTTPGGAR